MWLFHCNCGYISHKVNFFFSQNLHSFLLDGYGFPFYGVLPSWTGNSSWSKLAFSIGNIICTMNTKWFVHPTQTFGVDERDGFERRGLQEISQLSVSGLRWQKLYFLHHDVLHKDIIFTAMQRKRETDILCQKTKNDFFHFPSVGQNHQINLYEVILFEGKRGQRYYHIFRSNIMSKIHQSLEIC